MTYQAKRRIIRIIIFVLFFLLPFIAINDKPIVRFDFHELSIFILGTQLSASHIFPLLLLCLAGLFFFIMVTQLFGRIWCGWLCPQTLLLGLSNDLVGARFARPIKIGVNLLISTAFAAGLLLYTMPPADFVARLMAGDLLILCVLALVIFLDLQFIGRRFCKTICPYANFQSVMYDVYTVRIGMLPDKADECTHCNACVNSCPTGIDIREGLNNKCVACAACVDTCADVGASCLGYFPQAKFKLNKAVSLVLALAFLITGLLMLSNIGGITATLSGNQELTLTSSYADTVVLQLEGINESYTLEKGESVIVPLPTRDIITLHIYQGRKEDTQEISLHDLQLERL
ncbi:MAG: 4Fe-4S binding protein [Deferribacteraceae bacterium]|jgi:polyferredoxin|nr:4Fe-4S binding protein [Deferribacteraceae bacterium]